MPEVERLLVVDDEAPILHALQRTFEAAGYEVIACADPSEALDRLREKPFQVLSADYMMPGMTGDELARILRQTEPTLKVLYLTGYSDRLFREKATLWADEAFLDKPCTMKGLREAVSLLVNGTVTPTAPSL